MGPQNGLQKIGRNRFSTIRECSILKPYLFDGQNSMKFKCLYGFAAICLNSMSMPVNGYIYICICICIHVYTYVYTYIHINLSTVTSCFSSTSMTLLLRRVSGAPFQGVSPWLLRAIDQLNDEARLYGYTPNGSLWWFIGATPSKWWQPYSWLFLQETVNWWSSLEYVIHLAINVELYVNGIISIFSA